MLDGLDPLPDELVLSVACALDGRSLATFQQVCTRTANLDTALAWQALCRERWRDKPRYALTPEREKWLEINLPLSWQQRYLFFEHDSKRSTLALSELSTLGWVFNFTRPAGSQGQPSRKTARFEDSGEQQGVGRLVLSGYPALPYVLETPGVQPPRSDDLSSTERAAASWRRPLSLMQHLLQSLVLTPHTARPPDATTSAEGASSASPPQKLLINNFPPHEVSRLLDSWEWMISNANVTFVSCASDKGVSRGLHEAALAANLSEHPVLGPRGF